MGGLLRGLRRDFRFHQRLSISMCVRTPRRNDVVSRARRGRNKGGSGGEGERKVRAVSQEGGGLVD
eukprot:4494915-Pyramimonas_sp.AAC.1